MSIFDKLHQLGSMMTARQVFGEPIERDGVTIIPVARIMGGGGGGGSNPHHDNGDASGEGGGFGMAAVPAGVYVIKDGHVRWQPALDVNRMVLGGQLLALAALIIARPVLQRWLKQQNA